MFVRELRYAGRMARRAPVFTLVAIGSLAIAIGANSTVFSLLDAVLLRPLPVQRPGRLVAIHAVNRRGEESAFSYSAYQALRAAQTVFSGFFAYDGQGMYNVEANGAIFADTISRVSGNIYQTLGVNTLIGRPITPEDDGADGHAPQAVGVISYRLWRDYYGSDPHVLGRTVTVNGKPFVIVGVNKPEFGGLEVGTSDSVIVPIHGWIARFADASISKPRYAAYFLYGRLKPGITIEQARAEFAALWPRVRASSFPPEFIDQDAFSPQRVTVDPGATGESYLRRRYRKPLYVLMAAVAVLLLIACVNLANLLLARAATRRREMALRLSLGAGAGTLMRQCLIESVGLAIAGAAAGIAIAQWASRAIAAFLWTGYVPLHLNLTPDIRILGFTCGAAVLTGVLFGLAPALAAIRQDPALALQSSSRVLGGASNRFARALIVAQVALSIALLAGAALFARSLRHLRSDPLGFRTDHLLVAQLMPRPNGHKDVDLPKYYAELLREVRAIPGVGSAGISARRPVEIFDWKQPVSVPGGPPVNVQHNEIGAGFFEALGMNLLSGRDIDDGDTLARPAVAVISATLARRLFPNGDAVGRYIVSKPGASDKQDVRVIGVVNDARMHNLRDASGQAIYYALYQDKNIGWPCIVVRVRGAPEDIAPRLRRAIESRGREFALRIETVNDQIDGALIQDRLLGYLCSFFACVALLLAAIGLYGLLSFSVSRRVPEIGIRMALGARPGRVSGLIIYDSMRIVLWGAALGIVLALYVARLIAAFLYDVSPRDPAAMAVATAALLSVALAASWLPARRAARVDPVTALRTE
jgi:predicted permease